MDEHLLFHEMHESGFGARWLALRDEEKKGYSKHKEKWDELRA